MNVPQAGSNERPASWLIQKTGNLASQAIYLVVLSGITLIGLLTLKTGKNKQLLPAYRGD